MYPWAQCFEGVLDPVQAVGAAGGSEIWAVWTCGAVEQNYEKYCREETRENTSSNRILINGDRSVQGSCRNLRRRTDKRQGGWRSVRSDECISAGRRQFEMRPLCE